MSNHDLVNLDNKTLFNILALDIQSSANEFITTGSEYTKGQLIATAKLLAEQFSDDPAVAIFLEADHAS